MFNTATFPPVSIFNTFSYYIPVMETICNNARQNWKQVNYYIHINMTILYELCKSLQTLCITHIIQYMHFCASQILKDNVGNYIWQNQASLVLSLKFVCTLQHRLLFCVSINNSYTNLSNIKQFNFFNSVSLLGTTNLN